MPADLQIFVLLGLSGLFWWATAAASARWLGVGFFLGTILPAALLPYWIWDPSNHAIALKWFKVLLIHGGVGLMTWARYRARQGHAPSLSTKRVLAWALYVNILFIGLWCALRGAYLNAGLAVLLVLTLPAAGTLEISTRSPFGLRWDLGWIWIVAYSLWDWCFLHRLLPEVSGLHLALLLAPMVASARDQGRWMELRAYSLGLYVAAVFTFQETKQLFWTTVPAVSLSATTLLELLALAMLGVATLRAPLAVDSVVSRWWRSLRRRAASRGPLPRRPAARDA